MAFIYWWRNLKILQERCQKFLRLLQKARQQTLLQQSLLLIAHHMPRMPLLFKLRYKRLILCLLLSLLEIIFHDLIPIISMIFHGSYLDRALLSKYTSISLFLSVIWTIMKWIFLSNSFLIMFQLLQNNEQECIEKQEEKGETEREEGCRGSQRPLTEGVAECSSMVYFLGFTNNVLFSMTFACKIVFQTVKSFDWMIWGEYIDFIWSFRNILQVSVTIVFPFHVLYIDKIDIYGNSNLKNWLYTRERRLYKWKKTGEPLIMFCARILNTFFSLKSYRILPWIQAKSDVQLYVIKNCRSIPFYCQFLQNTIHLT